MVPKEAFRRITGIVGNIIQSSTSPMANSGTCTLRDREDYGPLDVGWTMNGKKKTISGRMKRIKDNNMDSPKRLPSQLGYGFTAYAPSESESAPYVVSAVFRCDGKMTLIDIDLRRVSQGRDASKDLADLMHIAQGRFGELHHCAPGPL
jgi:hypothetical protein